MPTAVREVDRAEEAGIVRSRNVGRTRLVTANTHSFAYQPLRELLLRAFGPLAVVTAEFANLRGIDQLFVFGSWAARYTGDSGHEPRDVDVLIVGTPDRGAAYDGLSVRSASCIAPCKSLSGRPSSGSTRDPIRSCSRYSVDRSLRSTVTPGATDRDLADREGRDRGHDLPG